MKNTIFRYFSPGCSFEKDLAAEIMDLDLALALAFLCSLFISLACQV